MRRREWSPVLGLLLLCAGLVPPAAAQEYAVAEVSAGYARAGHPLGAYVSAGWRPARRVVFVGEGTVAHENTHPDRYTRTEFLGWTALGGVRLMPSPPARVDPFLQVLVGVGGIDHRVRSDESAPFFPSLDIRVRTTGFTFQYGLGLTWWIQPRVGAQLGASYRRLFWLDGKEQLALHFGVAFGLGPRR